MESLWTDGPSERFPVFSHLISTLFLHIVISTSATSCIGAKGGTSGDSWEPVWSCRWWCLRKFCLKKGGVNSLANRPCCFQACFNHVTKRRDVSKQACACVQSEHLRSAARLIGTMLSCSRTTNCSLANQSHGSVSVHVGGRGRDADENEHQNVEEKGSK